MTVYVDELRPYPVAAQAEEGVGEQDVRLADGRKVVVDGSRLVEGTIFERRGDVTAEPLEVRRG